MANPFVHIELQTKDAGKAKQFYQGLFDWKIEDMDMGPDGTYTMATPGEGPTAGIFAMPGAPPMWVAYVQVANVEASTKKAKELGGTVLKDRTEVPGMGAFTIISDPTGATIGLWEVLQK
jgi:uncharacterized protein